MRRALLRAAWPLAAAALLSGCAGVDLSALNPVHWFAAEKPKPTPLETFTPKLEVRSAWSAKLDSVDFPLAVAVNGAVFTAAGTDGSVVAFDAEGGRERWRAQVGQKLSAGVGSDGRFAAVVTRDNELVVVEAGSIKWRTRLNSHVVTPPLVAGERVFVVGVDRVVVGFDVLDGRKLWALQRPSDALTLSQPGVLAAYKDTLLVGLGPRLTGVDPLRGSIRWEAPLATPRGTNEVERLADLVGPALRADDTVCARAFQSAVGCANAARGIVLWSKNIGGIQALGGDADVVVGGDASDRLTAWRTSNGDVAWTHERLLHRALSGALGAGKSVVFGDFEGYVHFLSRDSGETLQRVATDGSPIVGTPVRSGGTVLVATRHGGLFAFRPAE